MRSPQVFPCTRIIPHGLWQIPFITSSVCCSRKAILLTLSAILKFMILLFDIGAYCTSPKLITRLVAGLFCLAACVLVYGYSSLLITYVIAPNNPPLIRSVHDLLRNENIKLVVDKAKGVDLIISVINLKNHLIGSRSHDISFRNTAAINGNGENFS